MKTLTIGVLLASTVMVTLFGRTPADLQRLSIICGVAGFCINAGIVGLYAIIAQVFPTHMRACGTGFAIGVGRGGSVFAPIIAGFLFAAGYSLPTVALLLGLGSLFAAASCSVPEARDRMRPAVERPDRRIAGCQRQFRPSVTRRSAVGAFMQLSRSVQHSRVSGHRRW